MNRIRIIGGLIFFLSIILALLSNFVANKNRVHSSTLAFIGEQKSFTQEISKSIFYAYRNGDKDSMILDQTIKKYLENSKIDEVDFTQNRFVTTLWNIFYADVQRFRNLQKVSTGYNPVITAKLVNRIYHNNVLLVNQFNALLAEKQVRYQEEMQWYKGIEYILFIVLIGLLLYFFTQLEVVITFIQKFSNTSKKIIENSTIEGLEPIIVEQKGSKELEEATKNYNHLIKKIDDSIMYATDSMEQTTKSLEKVAKNIEDFMELLSAMHDNESDEIFEKEDAVIDSLENIMHLRKKLKYLQKDLDKLISQKEL